jgi:hypothetical protein
LVPLLLAALLLLLLLLLLLFLSPLMLLLFLVSNHPGCASVHRSLICNRIQTGVTSWCIDTCPRW